MTALLGSQSAGAYFEGAIIVTCGDTDPNCEAAAARYKYQQEQVKVAAVRKRKVDVEVQKLGEHRRAEAERLVDMREAADRARPKNPYGEYDPASFTPIGSEPPVKACGFGDGNPSKKCAAKVKPE